MGGNIPIIANQIESTTFGLVRESMHYQVLSSFLFILLCYLHFHGIQITFKHFCGWIYEGLISTELKFQW